MCQYSVGVGHGHMYDTEHRFDMKCRCYKALN